MKIKIRLFATLREGRGKELMMEFKEEVVTPNHVIDKLNISKGEIAILLINGRDGEMNTPLKAEDVVSLFPPVGGG